MQNKQISYIQPGRRKMEDSISNSKKNKFRKLKYIKLIAKKFKMQLGTPTEA